MTDVPRTVLVVEDSETTRKILEHTFQAEGYVPVLVASVQEAVHTLKTVVPDLVVLESRLPDASAASLVRSMRGERAMQGVPIVLISDHGADHEDVAPLRQFCAAFFVKPFSLKKLVASVRELLASRASA